MTRTISTTCPYCGVGCGVSAEVSAMAHAWRATRAIPPISAGSASRARRSAQVLTLEERLLHPRVDGEQASWDDALATVARVFGETIAEHGPDSVAFYVSGQLLTEDYYVANKLMKGFVGSGNIDTNSRLCMSASVAGHKRAFGSDTVPGVLRGSRTSRSRRPRRLQSGLVPPDPVSAARGGAREARRVAEDRKCRSAPHRDQRDRRSAAAHRRRARMSRCSPACCAS